MLRSELNYVDFLNVLVFLGLGTNPPRPPCKCGLFRSSSKAGGVKKDLANTMTKALKRPQLKEYLTRLKATFPSGARKDELSRILIEVNFFTTLH